MKLALLISSFLCAATSPAAQFIGGEYGFTDLTHSSSSDGASSIAAIGDVDGDGVPDLLVGHAEFFPGMGEIGTAVIYSGATGGVLTQVHGENTDDKFGSHVANAGDLSGDGIDDFLVCAKSYRFAGPPNQGKVYAFNGVSGALIRSWQGSQSNRYFGQVAISAGDVDGDGVPDVAISIADISRSTPTLDGRVRIYSGTNGAPLQEWVPPSWGEGYGAAMVNVGDANNDGIDDILVSAPLASETSGKLEAGAVWLHSGANGGIIQQWTPFPPENHFGSTLQSVGDINLDGYPEFLIGAPDANIFANARQGIVGLYSANNGEILHEWAGRDAYDGFGSGMASAGDVNRDGILDYYISSPNARSSDGVISGSIDLYSGADYSLLRREFGTPFSQFGRLLANIGDTNADGFEELLCAHTEDDSTSPQVMSFNPFMLGNKTVVAAATGGSMTLELDFPPAARGYNYKILMSASGLGPIHYGVQVPLSFDHLTINSFHGDYSVPVHFNMHGALDFWGDATATISLPPDAFGNYPPAIYFAAIAFQGNGLAEYSSVAHGLRIIR